MADGVHARHEDVVHVHVRELGHVPVDELDRDSTSHLGRWPAPCDGFLVVLVGEYHVVAKCLKNALAMGKSLCSMRQRGTPTVFRAGSRTGL